MDEIIRHRLSNNQLIQINASEIFLNINHLNNLTLLHGKTIDNNFLIGIKPPYPI